MSSHLVFKRRFLMALLVIVVAVGGLIWFVSNDPAPPREIRHVLLISIDTCRADHLSCYGHHRKTTPNIDQLAGQAILFTHVVSPVPLTLPSHSTMLTGTSPPRHGVHDNINYRLGASQVTLAEMLDKQGFTTGAFISAFVLDGRFGLNRGFDSYDDHIKARADQNVTEFNERRGGDTTRLAKEWLSRHHDEKFFLFLHYFDPHVKYDPPEPFASKFPDDPYAGEIAYVDHCIGRIIRKLKDLSLYDSTLIIVTSDHGEMLGDHDEHNHSYFIYQSAIRVPLIIKVPGYEIAKTIDQAAGIIDIVPTVCGALGLEVPDHLEGYDLSGYFREERDPTGDRHYYCESYTPTKYSANALLGVVNDRWKYIQTTRPELYNLDEDPGETENLITRQPQQAQRLRKRLIQLTDQALRLAATDSKVELDDETLRRLESLGYVSGKVTEEFAFDSSREDPKDLLDFYLANTRVNTLIGERKFTQAARTCREILTQYPDSYRTRLHLAQIAVGLGDLAGAVPHLKEALRLKPNSFEVHDLLGAILLQLGKLDDAIRHNHTALRLLPGALKVRNNLGIALAAKGELEEAIVHLKQVVEAAPEMTDACINLAKVLSDHGQTEAAITHLEKSLEHQRGQFAFHNQLAELHHQRKDLVRCIFHFSESLRLNAHQPDVLSRLANVYMEQGQFNQAIDCFNRALLLRPDWPTILNNLAWIRAAHSDPQLRDPAEAIRLATRACDLTGHKNPVLLDTLATAQAAAGRFTEAVNLAQKAIDLAQAAGQQALAQAIQHRLQLFEQDQSYHD